MWYIRNYWRQDLTKEKYEKIQMDCVIPPMAFLCSDQSYALIYVHQKYYIFYGIDSFE